MAVHIYGNEKRFYFDGDLIGNIIEMTPGPKSAAAILATTTDSTSHEYRPGLLEPGNWSGSIKFSLADANATAMAATVGDGEVYDIEFELTDEAGTNYEISGSGFLVSWGLTNVTFDDLVVAEFEIKLTGDLFEGTGASGPGGA